MFGDDIESQTNQAAVNTASLILVAKSFQPNMLGRVEVDSDCTRTGIAQANTYIG